MKWFWYFLVYSFLGFVLEVLFARLVRARPDRKCLLLLPLCPVYGLGACAILPLPALVGNRPLPLFLLGAAVCTAVEYAVALWYERGLGVAFWDYSGLSGSLHGRVCLRFSAAWGVLSLLLLYRVQPWVERIVPEIPTPVSAAALLTVLADMAVSALMLRQTGDRACLRWYRANRRGRQTPPRPVV